MSEIKTYPVSSALNSQLSTLKEKLREHIHVRLREAAHSASPDAANHVRDFFLNHFKNLDMGAVVAGTAPIKHELNPAPLMDALAAKGHALCLPVTLEKATPLVFRSYKTGDVLVPDRWNIGVPADDKSECVPDIILCPLLAFDKAGRRLGYGGGYYDATLKSLRAKKTIVAVGLAFAMQEVEEVPVGGFDERLDVIITEKEVILPNGQA